MGSGPAGASCATFCAQAGLRTLVLERAQFPREKVCGDCLNPACHTVFDRLGVSERVRQLPHGRLARVEFIAIGGHAVSVPFPGAPEMAVKRSLLDALLAARAREAGAEIREGATVTALHAESDGWQIITGEATHRARLLVAADGRNSSVARLLGLLPRIARERVGLQTHLPLPNEFGDRIVLQFLPQGYSGQAPVGEDELNVCLVGKPGDMSALRDWAEKEFKLPPRHPWRTITPLRRGAIAPAQKRLLLVGDAARVVEPFTGEGIYYALRTGELAAEAISAFVRQNDIDAAARAYATAHAKLYRGRLWINRIARAAVLSPRIASLLLRSRFVPSPLLATLTSKVSR